MLAPLIDAGLGASMRPRLIASENNPAPRFCAGAHIASMRPRLIASENVNVAYVLEQTGKASMRPRLIASENIAEAIRALASIMLQ